MPDRVNFRCNSCGKRFATRPEMIGKTVRCSGCGTRFEVPSPEAVPPPARVDAEPAVEPRERSQPKTKKRRKKSDRADDTVAKDLLMMLGATLGGLLVVCLLCYRYEGLRFVLGGIAVVVGSLVYMVGTFIVSAAAEEEGSHHHALMCRFVPLYKWFYILSRWNAMKEYFVFLLVGVLLFWPGVILVKCSPEWNEGKQRNDALYKADPKLAPPEPSAPWFAPSLD